MTTTSVGSPTVGLGRFIQESRFIVPSHQRDFSWTDEYVRQFLRDIEEAISSKRESYFCGLMVFTTSSPGVFKVLDGQQRLATTLMLFSAVRNWLGGFSEFDDLRHQVGGYLGITELGATQPEPRLTMTAANNAAYQRLVTSALPLREMEKALKQKSVESRSTTLAKAVIYVNRYVSQRASDFSSHSQAREYFVSLLKYMSDQVQIVRFVLSTDSAAYTIFETLNDRGLELAPLDLVKNYLFSQADKFRPGSLSEFEERWAEMMALLSSSKADSFLRAFWSSRHGKPQGADLFSAFKRNYSDAEEIYSLSIDMRKDAERYAALFSPDDQTWASLTEKARKSVEALGIIGFSQAHPIILSALGRLEISEMERLLWLIECVAVRHQLIGRRRPGRVESLGGRAAKEIFDGRVTTTSAVFQIIKELYVPDDEFRLAFEAHSDSGKKARYLLSGLEREAVNRNPKALSGEIIPFAVTLEHILPQSIGGVWARQIALDHEWDASYVSRLGNLCLLTSINSTLGIASFDEKKLVFSRSRLITTNEVAHYKIWGREQIVNRQKHLANLAVSAWRFQ